MDRRSGSSAPFRITPASKPGAGGQDHWEGAPSWGNTHGAEWFELAGTVGDPSEPSSTSVINNFRSGDPGPETYINRPYSDLSPGYYPIQGKTDWKIVDFEPAGETYGPNAFRLFLERTVSAFKLWNVYRYEFLEWKPIRQEQRTA